MGKTRQLKAVSGEYFPALTGIRTIAATMVFLHHFNPFHRGAGGIWLRKLVGEFHVGVTIFFVLSGFLIAYRYWDTPPGKGRLRKYFVNRFGRIYPMYFIVTIVCFLPWVCHCLLRDHWGVLLLNLSFLRGLFDQYKFTGAPAGWSLTLEEMFYAIFPLIVFFAGRRKLFLQPLILLFTGLVLWAVFRNISFHGFFGSAAFLFEFTFFGRCVEFYTGIALALYVRQHKDRLPTAGTGTSRTIGIRTFAGMLWIIAGIAALAINRQVSTIPGHFLFFETLVNNFLLPPGIALLFYGLLTEQSIIRKLLANPLMTLLGKASYTFYLIHNTLLFAVLYNLLFKQVELVYIATQVISVLLYLGVEKPLNRYIRRKFAAPVRLRSIEKTPGEAG